MVEAALTTDSDREDRERARVRLERAFRDCEAREGRPATNLEICGELGLTLREFYALLETQRGIGLGRLDELVSENLHENPDPLVRYAPDAEKKECFGLYPKSLFRAAMEGAIEGLPKNEKLVVSLHHNEGVAMKEIAQIFGISEMRVAQIHTTAMLRIRSKLQALELARTESANEQVAS